MNCMSQPAVRQIDVCRQCGAEYAEREDAERCGVHGVFYDSLPDDISEMFPPYRWAEARRGDRAETFFYVKAEKRDGARGPGWRQSCRCNHVVFHDVYWNEFVYSIPLWEIRSRSVMTIEKRYNKTREIPVIRVDCSLPPEIKSALRDVLWQETARIALMPGDLNFKAAFREPGVFLNAAAFFTRYASTIEKAFDARLSEIPSG